MSDSEVEASFSVLPARLKRRIDRAFDNAIIEADHSAHSGPPRKKRKLASPTGEGGFIPASPGGYLVEDRELTPGGFIPEESPAGGFFSPDGDTVQAGDRTSESSEDEDIPSHPMHTHIPLPLIPAALQLLDLQPDDEDVLSVFRNAASGWEGVRGSGNNQADLHVSRKDWRAVCTALLDNSAGEDGEEARDRNIDEEVERDEELESEDDSDAYSDSGESESEEADSDDEYQEGGFTRTRTSKRKSKASTPSKRKKTRAESSDLTSGSEVESVRPKRITPRQRQECRNTFAMFFPDVPDENLDEQRIMIKDISRVAILLKEKITTEEIIEMLEVFSTSPDKSMSLSDFERMMVTAKLA